MRGIIETLQPLGRALMLPIAVLPIAGLMLRFGQPDLLAMPFVAAAGDAIFSVLGLLFAIGVAVGLAKDNNGAAGLAGAVCFMVASKGAGVLLQVPPSVLDGVPQNLQAAALAAFENGAIAKLGVPIGILSGVISGHLYNHTHHWKLPDHLAFFAGRRLVPILSGLAGLALAALFGGGWQWLDHGITALSSAVLGLGPVGLLLYGTLNRLLIITGLHHILNNMAWFILGSFHGATGDLNRFFAGDPTAGAFMSGFFPVMMFGLPAACLAMYRQARPERRKAVGGMLMSMALTSFLTGVTEPIEFSFMFLAPALYALHALLTGVAMMGMNLLGIHLGFSFSAGLFDYVINFKLASRPLWLIPVGLGYATVYYFAFTLVIRLFNLKTPGREDAAAASSVTITGQRDQDFLAALGGAGNLEVVDACTTRLRLIVRDQAKVDEVTLRALGAKGMVRPSDKALQVVLGPIADQVAGEIRAAMAKGSPAVPASDGKWLLAALGGKANVKAIEARGQRLMVEVAADAAVDGKALNAATRGAVSVGAAQWQILVSGDAEAMARGMLA